MSLLLSVLQSAAILEDLKTKITPEMVKKVTTPSLLLASRPRLATVAGHYLTNLCAPLSPWPSLAPHVFSLFV
jgi:hypothetical protein